ncbi:copper homeostasis protein CutC [Maribacter sp. MJ134]|uniref:copper homeostasis protein CutC n=1 Tax=Maribacter sp. MJ134 TaxID=2496865 RepID=UPI000F84A838|nr:copper homeostasis protein CutC [Maribacter sp. MJ134]AZQ59119.1 copper homeostasis protein CutC [Maribacter sp. MJ134]
MLVEVCANSLESALNAQEAGADRIELCSELAVGGITPSYGLLKAVREEISIPVHVLVRPRSGDFTFSNIEFEIMKADILLCKELGFQGIVSGVLHADHTLDNERTQELVKCSEGMNFTFHRAFDWVKNPIIVLKQLEEMGVDYLLTSGQKQSAIEGITLLDKLNANSTSCAIMPGSGVKEYNVAVFMDKGFKAVHLSGTQFQKTLDMQPMVSMNSVSFLKDDQIAVSSKETIAAVVNKVK